MNLPPPRPNGNICLDNGMVVRRNSEGIVVPMSFNGRTDVGAKVVVCDYVAEHCGVPTAPSFHCLEWKLLKYSSKQPIFGNMSSSNQRWYEERAVDEDNSKRMGEYHDAQSEYGVAGFRLPAPIEIVSALSVDCKELVGLYDFFAQTSKQGWQSSVPTNLFMTVDGIIAPSPTHNIKESVFKSEVRREQLEHHVDITYNFSSDFHDVLYGVPAQSRQFIASIPRDTVNLIHPFYNRGEFTLCFGVPTMLAVLGYSFCLLVRPSNVPSFSVEEF